MSEYILVRHAESHANTGNFVAFGNEDSPLNENGIKQIPGIRRAFKQLGIIPSEYEKPVLTSEFVRTKETAKRVGFRFIDHSPLINEARVDEEVRSGIKPVLKHAAERWVPDTIKEPASRFVDMLQSGGMGYEIFFTHGMFIAGALLECDERGIQTGVPFDPKRGYVPLRAAVTKITIA